MSTNISLVQRTIFEPLPKTFINIPYFESERLKIIKIFMDLYFLSVTLLIKLRLKIFLQKSVNKYILYIL